MSGTGCQQNVKRVCPVEWFNRFCGKWRRHRCKLAARGILRRVVTGRYIMSGAGCRQYIERVCPVERFDRFCGRRRHECVRVCVCGAARRNFLVGSSLKLAAFFVTDDSISTSRSHPIVQTGLVWRSAESVFIHLRKNVQSVRRIGNRVIWRTQQVVVSHGRRCVRQSDVVFSAIHWRVHHPVAELVAVLPVFALSKFVLAHQLVECGRVCNVSVVSCFLFVVFRL